MTEQILKPPLKFDEYTRFVESSRFAEISDTDWREKYAAYIEGEYFELLMQHGHGMFVLLPDSFGFDRSGVPDELCYHMADEMGDSLWFTTDIAERAGTSVQDCVAAALAHRGIEVDTPVDSFAALEKVAFENAGLISVINKRGIYFGGPGTTSLGINPQYVHMRTSARLSRALAQERYDDISTIGPLSATSLEDVVDLSVAIGDFLLAQAFCAKDRMGIPIEDIARFNMAKLKYRRIHGKENDFKFGPDSLASM